jgi:SSS family solute:Na+ symporter
MIWFQVTTAVFVGGAGAAIIGGLYWKWGTTAGAWVGFLTGSGLSVGGIITRVYWQKTYGEEFFLNGMQIGFTACLVAVVLYVIVSLLTCREPHNMDRLLNRGKYAVEPEGDADAKLYPKVSIFNRIL